MTLAGAGKSGEREPKWEEEDVDLTACGSAGENLVVELRLDPDECHEHWQYALFRGDVPMPSDRYQIQTRGNVVQLTLKQSQKEDSGHYALVAKKLSSGLSISGDERAESRHRIRLTIQDPSSIIEEGEPPIFLRRPSDLAVKVGTRTRFLVEIRSSTSPKVTWHKNDEPLQSGSRFSFVHEGNFYCVDVAPVMVDDQGHWTCMAENGSGRSSCTSFLSVIVPKAYKKPEFVEELRAILTETGTVSLECKVVGVPTPVLKWFKDQKEIKAGDVFALTANPDDPTSLGTYTCEAVNCMGTAYSSSRVHVMGKGSREGSLKPADALAPSGPLPVFRQILRDESCRIGDALVLACQVNVPPWPKDITWYNKEGRVEAGDKYNLRSDGLGGYSIEIKGVEAMDEGEWKCVATSTENMKQFSTCHVAMSIPKNYRMPRFMESLKAVLTEEGLVSFECKVVGFPTPLLRWFKDGQELHPGDVYQLTGTNSLGSYCCIARNCMGEAKSVAELTVEDIQNQLNEEERMQLMSSNQAPKFVKGLRSCEARINEDFTFTIQVSVSPEPSLSWYRDDVAIIESERYRLAREALGTCNLEVKKLEFVDQAEWKCVAANDFGHSVTSCFLKLVIPKHFKKPKFLESLRAILSEEGAVNLECKVIGVPQPILKWYKDGIELKPGDIHRIISGQDGTCCLGTYTCEATNCMGSVSSSASLLGFEDRVSMRKEEAKEPVTPLHELARNLSLSTIHEERTSQLYDTPQTDHSITMDDRGEVSFSFDGKEVSVSLYETPDLTEEEALQIVEMYADQLSEHITEGNVIELPPMRFTKETSTTGNLLMEAVVIDVSPDYFVPDEEGDDLRTEADVEDVSIMDDQLQSIRSLSYVSSPTGAETSGVPSGSPPSRPPRRKESRESFSSRSERSDKSLAKAFDWSESYHSAREPSMQAHSSAQAQDDSGEAFTDALSSSARSKAEESKDVYASLVERNIERIALDETMAEVSSKRDLNVEGETIATQIGQALVEQVPLKKKRKKKRKSKSGKSASRTPSLSSKASSEESYSPDLEETTGQRRASKNGAERRGSLASSDKSGKDRRSGSESGNFETAAPSPDLRRRESDATIMVDDLKIEQIQDIACVETIDKTETPQPWENEQLPASETPEFHTNESDRSSLRSNKERMLESVHKLSEPIMSLRNALVDIDNLLPLLQTQGSPAEDEKSRMEIDARIVHPIENLCEQVSAIETKALKSAGDRSLAQNVRISLLETIGGPTEELLRGIELIRRHSGQQDPKSNLIVLESLTDPVDEILVGLARVEKDLCSGGVGESVSIQMERPIALERMSRAVSRLGDGVEVISERKVALGDEATSLSVIERLQSVCQSLEAFVSTVPLTETSGALEHNVDTLVVESLVRPLEELSRKLDNFGVAALRTPDERDLAVANLETSMVEMRTRLEALTVALETYERESGEQGITELHADLVKFLRYTMDDASERLAKLKTKRIRVSQESQAKKESPTLGKRANDDEESAIESSEPEETNILQELAEETAGIMKSVTVPTIARNELAERDARMLEAASLLPTIDEKSSPESEQVPVAPTTETEKPSSSTDDEPVRERSERSLSAEKTTRELPEIDAELSLPEMLLDPLIDVQANLSDVISDFESQVSAEEYSLPGNSELAACLTELRESVAAAAHTATTLKSADTVDALVDLREPLLDLQLAMTSAVSHAEVKLIREATAPLSELKVILAAVIGSPQTSEASQVQMKSCLRMLEDIEAEVTKISAPEDAPPPAVAAETPETRTIPTRPPEEVERAAIALTGVHFALSSVLERVTPFPIESDECQDREREKPQKLTTERSGRSNLIVSIEELRQSVGNLAVAIGTPVVLRASDDRYSYEIVFEELAKLEEPLLNLQRVLLTEQHDPEDRHLLNDLAAPIRSLKEIVQNVASEMAGATTPPILDLIEDVEKDVTLIAMEALKRALATKSETAAGFDNDPRASISSSSKPGEIPGVISTWLDPIEDWLTSCAEETTEIDVPPGRTALAPVIDNLKRELLKIAIRTSYSEPPSDAALIESLTELSEPIARAYEALAVCHGPENLEIVEGLVQPAKHLLGTILDASVVHEAGKVLRPVLEAIEELENQIPLTIKRIVYERELQRVVRSMTPEETLMAEDIPQARGNTAGQPPTKSLAQPLEKVTAGASEVQVEMEERVGSLHEHSTTKMAVSSESVAQSSEATAEPDEGVQLEEARRSGPEESAEEQVHSVAMETAQGKLQADKTSEERAERVQVQEVKSLESAKTKAETRSTRASDSKEDIPKTESAPIMRDGPEESSEVKRKKTRSEKDEESIEQEKTTEVADSKNSQAETVEVITVDSRPFAGTISLLESGNSCEVSDTTRADQLDLWTLTLLGPLDRLGNAVLSLDRSIDELAHGLLCRPLDSLHKQIEIAESQFNRPVGQSLENDVETIIEGFLSPVNQLHSALSATVNVWNDEQPRIVVRDLLRSIADSSTELCELLDTLRAKLTVRRAEQTLQEQQEDASLVETINAVVAPLEDVKNLIEGALKSLEFVESSGEIEPSGHQVKQQGQNETIRESLEAFAKMREGEATVEGLESQETSIDKADMKSEEILATGDTLLQGEEEPGKLQAGEAAESSPREKVSRAPAPLTRAPKVKEDSLDIEETTAKPLEELIEAIVDSSVPRPVSSSPETHRSLRPEVPEENDDKREILSAQEEIAAGFESTADIGGKQSIQEARILPGENLATAEVLEDTVVSENRVNLAENIFAEVAVETLRENQAEGEKKDRATIVGGENLSRVEIIAGPEIGKAARQAVTEILAKAAEVGEITEKETGPTTGQRTSQAEEIEDKIHEGILEEGRIDNVIRKNLAMAEAKEQRSLTLETSAVSQENVLEEGVTEISMEKLTGQSAELSEGESLVKVAVADTPELRTKPNDEKSLELELQTAEVLEVTFFGEVDEAKAKVREGESLPKADVSNAPQVITKVNVAESSQLQVVDESVHDTDGEKMNQQKAQIHEEESLANAAVTGPPELGVHPREAKSLESEIAEESACEMSIEKIQPLQAVLGESESLAKVEITNASETRLQEQMADISEGSARQLVVEKSEQQRADIGAGESLLEAVVTGVPEMKIRAIDTGVSQSVPEMAEESVREIRSQESNEQKAELREESSSLTKAVTDVAEARAPEHTVTDSVEDRCGVAEIAKIVAAEVAKMSEELVIEAAKSAIVEIIETPTQKVFKLKREGTGEEETAEIVAKIVVKPVEEVVSMEDRNIVQIVETPSEKVIKVRIPVEGKDTTLGDVIEEIVVKKPVEGWAKSLVEEEERIVSVSEAKVQEFLASSVPPDLLQETRQMAQKDAEEIECSKLEESERLTREEDLAQKTEAERAEQEEIACQEKMREEERSKREEDEHVKQQKEENERKEETERLEREELERQEKSLAEAERLRQEEEEKLREEAERLERESQAQEERERCEKEEQEAERVRKEEERLRQEEEEAAKLRKEEAEKLEKAQLEKAQKEKEAEKLRKEESERLEREESERKKQEAERAQREAAEKLEKEESERKAQEAERTRKEETERLEREELRKRQEEENLKKEEERRAKEEAEKLEKEKLEREEREAERLKQEQLERARKEEERRQKEEAEKLETEKLEREKCEAERLKEEELERAKKEEEERRQKEEAERLEKEKLELKKREAERLKQEELERAKKEEERLKKEEAERLKKEELERAKKEEEERLKKEEAEKLEMEKLERAQRDEEERIRKEEADKLEKEKLERAKREEEERLKKEEAEKLEKENLERAKKEEEERLEREEADKLEREKLERAKKEEEEERLKKEEADKLEREELERAKKEEEERFKKEEADKLAREKLERAKKEEEERIKKAEADKLEMENLERAKKEEEERLKKEEAEKLEKENLERVKKEEEERLKKEEAEKLEREKLERVKKEEEEQLKREEAEKLEREKLKRVKKEEEERLKKEEAERLEKEKVESAKKEEERLRREEERLKKEEAERLAQEKLERMKKEEDERLKKEEAAKLEKEEQERAKKEEERLKREEDDRLKREEEERLKREEEERLKREEDARLKREEEKRLNEEKERVKREEEERLQREETERLESEKLERARKEKEEQLKKEEAEKLEKEKMERAKKEEEERLKREEAEKLEREKLDRLKKEEEKRAKREESEKLEKEKLKREKQEAEKLKQEELERARKEEEERLKREEAEKLEKEKLDRARKEEEERVKREEAEKLEKEKLEREKQEAERLKREESLRAKEKEERLKKEEAERLEKEKLERARKEEEERLEREKRGQLERQKQEDERKKQEELSKKEALEKLEKDNLEREEAESRKREEEKLEKEKQAKEAEAAELRIKEEAEKLEKEKLAKEKEDAEKQKKKEHKRAERLKKAEEERLNDEAERQKIQKLELQLKTMETEKSKNEEQQNEENTQSTFDQVTEAARRKEKDAKEKPNDEAKRSKKQDSKEESRTSSKEKDSKDGSRRGSKKEESKQGSSPRVSKKEVSKEESSPRASKKEESKEVSSPRASTKEKSKEGSSPRVLKKEDSKEESSPKTSKKEDSKEESSPRTAKKAESKEGSSPRVSKKEKSKEESSPRASEKEESKEASSPRVSKKEESKEGSSPRASKKEKSKEESSPRASKKENSKEVSSPRVSKKEESKEGSSPRASKKEKSKEESSPRASKKEEPKESSSPRVSKKEESKEGSSPRISKKEKSKEESSPRISKKVESKEGSRRSSKKEDDPKSASRRASVEGSPKEGSRRDSKKEDSKDESPQVSKKEAPKDEATRLKKEDSKDESPRVSKKEAPKDEATRLKKEDSKDESPRVSKKETPKDEVVKRSKKDDADTSKEESRRPSKRQDSNEVTRPSSRKEDSETQRRDQASTKGSEESRPEDSKTIAKVLDDKETRAEQVRSVETPPRVQKDGDDKKSRINDEAETREKPNERHVRLEQETSSDREPPPSWTIRTDSELDSEHSESTKSMISRDQGLPPKSRRRRSGQLATTENELPKERHDRQETERQLSGKLRDDTLSLDDQRHYTSHYSTIGRSREFTPGPRDRGKKPSFCTKLTDRTAAEGLRIKLTCTVLGDPEPGVYWTKDGRELPSSSNRHCTIEEYGMCSLELYAALPKDSGEYSCVAQNIHGLAHTEAKLKVYAGYEPLPTRPTFTRSIKDTYRTAENELVLECRVRGQPSPKITWLKDGQVLQIGDRYQQSDLGDGSCRLKISRPDFYDSGLYSCRAENDSKVGDCTSHVVNFDGKDGTEHGTRWRGSYRSLTSSDRDVGRPRFSSYLTDHSVPAGGTIALQVEVKGVPQPDITWMRGDKREPIPAHKARTFADAGVYTLIVPEATESETGTYVCRASNAYGFVDTSANVEVVPSCPGEGGKPAMFVSRPAETMIHVTAGEDVSVSFRVSGVPKPRIVWMKGLRDITNGPRSYKESSDDYVRLTLKRAAIEDEGTYCIMAKNRYGCDRTFYTVKVKQRARSLTPSPDWGSLDTDNLLTSIHDTERSYLKQVPGAITSEPVVVDGGRNWLALSWGKAVQHGPAPVVAYRVDAWLLGGEGGARWAELGITPVNAFDAFNLRPGSEYKFRVTPRNRYGWGETVTMRNSVTVREVVKFPEFTKILPGQLKALRGETLQLECEVRSESRADVKWYRDTTDVETIHDPRYMTHYHGLKCTMTIQSIKENDSGRYVCEATNPAGRVSTFARVQVVTDPKIVEADEKLRRMRTLEPSNEERPPEFTMRLRDRRVQMTYPVRLTCQVSGHPEPEVTWYKNREKIYPDDNISFWDDESHFHTLEISHSSVEDSGIYMAKARNLNGSVSCRCHLVVDKGIRAYVGPEFLRHLDAVYTVKLDGELRMSAQIEAYPTVGIVWHRDGHRLRPSRSTVMTLNHDGSVELSLAHVTPRDAGLYCCTATNEVGRAESTTRVTVIGSMDEEISSISQSLPDVVESLDVPYSKEPVFVTKPLSTEAFEGDTVIILCEVIGDPKPEVIWLRDFLRPDYYRDAPHFRRVGAGPQYRLEIPYAKLDFTGAYTVIAKNCHGEAKAIISLQIYARGQGKSDSGMEHTSIKHGKVQTLPSIKQPLRDLRCCDGDAVTLICRVHATPEPDVRWEKSGKLVPLGEDFAADFDGETARLSIQHVYPEDEGEYTCVAYNDLGKAFTSACLIVDVPEGKESALSRRLIRPIGLLSGDSTPISTPRSTPIRSLSPACVISSRREVKPAVRPPRSRSSLARRPRLPVGPKFYAVPHNRVAEEGETVRFQCAIAGHPTPWVIWDKDGVPVTPTTRISLTEKDDVRILEIAEINHEDAGLYRITLENDVGRTEATARLEIIRGRQGSVPRTVRTRSASPRTYSIYSRSPISSAIRSDNYLRPYAHDSTDRRGGTLSPTLPRWQHRNGKTPTESPDPARRTNNQIRTTRKNGTTQKPPSPKVSACTEARSSSVPRQHPIHEEIPVNAAKSTTKSLAPRQTNEGNRRSNASSKPTTTTNGSMIPKRVGSFSRSRSPKVPERLNGSSRKRQDTETGSPRDHQHLGIGSPRDHKHLETGSLEQQNLGSGCPRESQDLRKSGGSCEMSNMPNEKIVTVNDDDTIELSGLEVRNEVLTDTKKQIQTENSRFIVENTREPRPPVILAAPADVTALRGSKVMLLATFDGEPQPRVRWLRKGRDVRLDDKAEIETSRGLTCLTLEGVTTEQTGKYAVTLENIAGRDCRYVDLTVEGVPDPPAGKPCVQSVTRSGKAIVTWRSPSYDGGCAVTGYSVEMKRSEDPCWIAVAEARHSLSHTVTGLETENTYSFRVRAENAHGLSEPGATSDIVTVPGENDEEIGTQVFTAEINQIEIEEEEDEFELTFEARIVSPEDGKLFGERYEVKEELGKGRYGLVRRIVEKSSGLTLAAKFVRTIKAKDRQQAHEEIDVMNRLRHPKLLRLAAAYENPKEMIMVTEYISGGELFERVVADDFTLTEKDSILFVKQICEGVEYMHSRCVVHLDLKPENIMCHTRTSHRIKLIDFGLAQTLNPDTPVRVLIGTPEFIPPEIIGYEPIGTESDMWSVGVICYVLLTGLSPFMGDNDAETFANITRADYDFDDKAFAAISAEAKDFISALLVKRKELRMSAKQCLEHPWLAQQAESMSSVALPTDKLKKFIVRRKWQKTGNAIRALGRMATLSANSRRNLSAASPPAKSSIDDELFGDVTGNGGEAFRPIQPVVMIEDRPVSEDLEDQPFVEPKRARTGNDEEDDALRDREDVTRPEVEILEELDRREIEDFQNGDETCLSVTELEEDVQDHEADEFEDNSPLIQEIDDIIGRDELKYDIFATETSIEEITNDFCTVMEIEEDAEITRDTFCEQATRKQSFSSFVNLEITEAGTVETREDNEPETEGHDDIERNESSHEDKNGQAEEAEEREEKTGHISEKVAATIDILEEQEREYRNATSRTPVVTGVWCKSGNSMLGDEEDENARLTTGVGGLGRTCPFVRTGSVSRTAKMFEKVDETNSASLTRQQFNPLNRTAPISSETRPPNERVRKAFEFWNK